MNAIAPAPPSQSRKSENELQQRLEDLLLIRFQPLPVHKDRQLVGDDGGVSSHSDIGDCDPNDWPSEEVFEAAASTVAERGYAVYRVSDGRAAVLLPRADRDPDKLSIGVTDAADLRLLDHLVNLTRKLVECEATLDRQTSDMDSCLQLLTDNMEEQCWLRTLSEQMRLCDLSRDTSSVEAELLTSLRDLIRAESTALVHGDFAAAPSRVPANILWSASGDQLQPGDVTAPDAIWTAWLRDLAQEHGARRSHVFNGDRVDARLKEFGVRSVLVVPLQSAGRPLGWIIAVNRQPRDHTTGDFQRNSESEFGTIEASLAEAAATLIATHSHNCDLLHAQEQLLVQAISSMSSAIDARDRYTHGHSQRVARYARRIVRRLGYADAECERFYLCGLLHDVGKIGVPDHVLRKPGRLTSEEFAEIKKHPEIGYRIVKNISQFADLLPGILHHHESLDGTGYPHGLSGDEVPFQARVIAVADAYDAMTSDRPYRSGMPHEKAARILRDQSGIQWDATLVDVFLESF